ELVGEGFRLELVSGYTVADNQCNTPNRRSSNTAATTSSTIVIRFVTVRRNGVAGFAWPPPVALWTVDRNPPRRRVSAPPPPLDFLACRRLRPIPWSLALSVQVARRHRRVS